MCQVSQPDIQLFLSSPHVSHKQLRENKLQVLGSHCYIVVSQVVIRTIQKVIFLQYSVGHKGILPSNPGFILTSKGREGIIRTSPYLCFLLCLERKALFFIPLYSPPAELVRLSWMGGKLQNTQSERTFQKVGIQGFIFLYGLWYTHKEVRIREICL